MSVLINKIVGSVEDLNPKAISIQMIKLWLNWILFHNYYHYKNKIKKYKGIGNGKKIVILCNGPSLNHVDFDYLIHTKVDTIGLNKINLLFNRTNFRPNYIVAINKYVIEQNSDFYEHTNIPLFIDFNGKKMIKSKNINLIYSLPLRGQFSKNICHGYCQGYTVTFAALQLAYFMGYDQVALVGCDHYFKDKGPPNKLVTSKGSDLNHFDINYFSNNNKWQLPDLIGSEYHYQIADEFFKNSNKQIFNCTEGGKLEIFKRISIKEFLNAEN